MRRTAASLPATPIGYFARRQWEELGTDELSVHEDVPAKQKVFPASSPASPLRSASSRRSAFRALQYARVGIDLTDTADDDEHQATTAPSLPPPVFEGDDEATERLLMLLSLPDAVANVPEIMRAASICYSAQLTEYAATRGDSSTFDLPVAVSLALSSFFAQPGVRVAIETGPDEEDRQTSGHLLALFESLPPPPQIALAPMVDPRAATAFATDGGASARLAAIGGDALDDLGEAEERDRSGARDASRARLHSHHLPGCHACAIQFRRLSSELARPAKH